ncbi:MAG: PspA/IM30 family protein [Cyanobacteria bacterium P01_A01_bin.37]
MSLVDRMARLIRATANSWLGKSEDPEKMLQQVVTDMDNDLISLRQSVAQAIATQKRTERQASQSSSVAEEWYRRAELAIKQGEDSLAKEALARRKAYLETANALTAQLDEQANVVTEMKANMRKLEGKLSEAKVKRDMYIARARSAKASQQLNEMLGGMGTGSSVAFERMGERVAEMEAKAEAIAELNSDGLEKKFAALEGSGDLDAELAALKTKLASSDDRQLPSSGSSN